MRNLIKKILKEETGSDICNRMTVNTYDEGIKLLKDYLGSEEENPKDWAKIKGPLTRWKSYSSEIKKEKYEDQMTGDSESDESNTWWTAIQTTFCK